MTKSLNNSVSQKLFFGGYKQPIPPTYFPSGHLIAIMSKPRMEGIGSFDSYGHGITPPPLGHARKYRTGDRGEVVGNDEGKHPCPHLPYVLGYPPPPPSVIGNKGDIKV